MPRPAKHRHLFPSAEVVRELFYIEDGVLYRKLTEQRSNVTVTAWNRLAFLKEPVTVKRISFRILGADVLVPVQYVMAALTSDEKAAFDVLDKINAESATRSAQAMREAKRKKDAIQAPQPERITKMPCLSEILKKAKTKPQPVEYYIFQLQTGRYRAEI